MSKVWQRSLLFVSKTSSLFAQPSFLKEYLFMERFLLQQLQEKISKTTVGFISLYRNIRRIFPISLILCSTHACIINKRNRGTSSSIHTNKHESSHANRHISRGNPTLLRLRDSSRESCYRMEKCCQRSRSIPNEWNGRGRVVCRLWTYP